MIIKYYSVFDKVAKEYGPLFYAKNDGVAKRMFNQMVNADKFDVSDYQLCGLFEFDTDTGCVVEEKVYTVVLSDMMVEDVNVSI